MTQPALKTFPYARIVCTGACPGMNRGQLELFCRRANITMQDRVTVDTEAVVAADPNGNSSKLKAARAKNIPVIGYETLLEAI